MCYFYQPRNPPVDFTNLKNFISDFLKTVSEYQIKEKNGNVEYRAIGVPIRVVINLQKDNTIYGFFLFDVDGGNNELIEKLKEGIINEFKLKEEIIGDVH
jgi:hypothetical protein